MDSCIRSLSRLAIANQTKESQVIKIGVQEGFGIKDFLRPI
jgi:hypothetical protein